MSCFSNLEETQLTEIEGGGVLSTLATIYVVSNPITLALTSNYIAAKAAYTDLSNVYNNAKEEAKRS